MGGITNPAEEYFKDGTWGWDGTQWRKLNLLWGFYDRICERIAVADATAGTNDLIHTIIPSGQVWILERWCGINSATASNCFIYHNDGSLSHVVKSYQPLPAGAYADFAFPAHVLKAGDVLIVSFTMCALHDTLYSDIFGYKMTVT